LKSSAAGGGSWRETIDCKIIECEDNQVEYIRVSENLHRQHLNAAQKERNKQLARQYLTDYHGPDPGQKATGRPRKAQARESSTHHDASKEIAATTSDDEKTLVTVTRVSENGDDPSPNELPEKDLQEEFGAAPEKSHKSHSAIMQATTGESRRTITRSKFISDRLTPEQLHDLSLIGDELHPPLTRKQLTAIAKIKHPERREMCINLLVVVQMTFEQAMEAAMKDDPETQKVIEYREQEAEPDATWPAKYCAKLRSRLEDPSVFDLESVIWRKTEEARVTLAHEVRELVHKVHWAAQRNVNFIRAIMLTMHTEHPNEWILCTKCKGQNKQDPYCEACDGRGYKIKINFPRPPRKK
jgi:hypothetical protein